MSKKDLAGMVIQKSACTYIQVGTPSFIIVVNVQIVINTPPSLVIPVFVKRA